MTYTYTLIDGQRVEASTVAPNFYAMAAEFKRVWGLELHVRSGTRTWDEQYRLWDGWNRRLPGYNLALHPDNPLAYHVETNPQGSRALDLYDSGNDAGVTRIGSPRNNWIRDNCPRWGFTLSGLTFNPQEGWHIHYTGTIGGGGAPAGGVSGGSFPARERYGADWVTSAQNKLNRLGFNAGAEDGYDGVQTQGATRNLQGVLGVDQDGIFGPITNEGADVLLAGRNAVPERAVIDIQRVVGATPDDQWGPLTSRAVYVWQGTQGLTKDAVWGPASDAKGFPVTSPGGGTVYPTTGTNVTTRDTLDIQKALIAKGFLADGQADGKYGPITSVAVAKFQEAEKVTVDGIYGNGTDARLFPGVPLPGAFVVTARTPVLPFADAGWNVPLGQSVRDEGSIITTYYIHHETRLRSDALYFKTKNDRGSAPTWEVDSAIIQEFIHPAKRPSATGKGNTYSVASETVNTTLAPTWEVSAASLESHARIAAWLHSVSVSDNPYFIDPDTGTKYRVAIALDRTSIKGHREAPDVEPTACPGPFVWDHMSWIVARAKEIYAAEYAPAPNPDPDPDPGSITLTLAQATQIVSAIDQVGDAMEIIMTAIGRSEG